MQEQTHAPTRRAVISSSVAAATVTTLPPGVLAVAAPVHPDARLLQLTHDLAAAEAVFYQALDQLEVVEDEILANGGSFALCSDEQAARRAEARAREDETSEAHNAILDQIAATPAVTVEGLRLKATIASRSINGPDMEPALAASIIKDVLALQV